MLHTASALPMLLWKSEFAPASRNHPWSSLCLSSSQLTVQRTHLVGQIPALRLHVSLESHLACLAQWLCFSFLSFFIFLNFTYSFIHLAGSGLSCRPGDLHWVKRSHSLLWTGSRAYGLLVAMHWLSCSMTSGILIPWRESTLHCKADF